MKEIRPIVSDFAMLEINYAYSARPVSFSVVYFNLDDEIRFNSENQDEIASCFFPKCVTGVRGVSHVNVTEGSYYEIGASMTLLLTGILEYCNQLLIRRDYDLEIINEWCLMHGLNVVNPHKVDIVDDSVFTNIPVDDNCFIGYVDENGTHRAVRFAKAIQYEIKNHING